MCDTQHGMKGYEHDVMTFELTVEQSNIMAPDSVLICGAPVGKANDKSFAIHDKKILRCFPNFISGRPGHKNTRKIASLIAPRALHLNLRETDSEGPIKQAR